MTIFVLTACPIGLRGHLTRWLIEISPGVFIGKISSRIRDFLWERVKEYSKNGRAIVAYQDNSEQGFKFDTWCYDWTPVDHDGLTLIRRREEKTIEENFIKAGLISPKAGNGLSNASKRRKIRYR